MPSALRDPDDPSTSAQDRGWQPIETAPTDTTVIVWGRGGMRFMRKDRLGQWRNMMHAPRPAPTHWMPLPEKPHASAE